MRHPGKSIEIKILELVRHRKYFTKFSRIIEPDFFTNPATRKIFEEIKIFFEANASARISHGDLLAQIRVKENDQDVLEEANDVLLHMKKKSKKIDEPTVTAIAIEWTRRNIVKRALYEGIDQLDRGNGLDLEPIRERLDVAANLGLDETQDYRYIAETVERLTNDSMIAPVGLGLPTADEILQGGLDVGELGLFIGPTHRGKTRALVNAGVNALRKGLHVAHVIVADSTAKRTARRYDSILCNRLYPVLRDNPKILRRYLQNIRKSKGKLVLREFNAVSPTSQDLRYWLKAYTERVPRKLDLLILDYLDEMRSNKTYKDFRHESRHVAGDVRCLASEFQIPIWTASQGNRASMNKNQVDLDDVAEDVWKVNRADVVVTLCQNEEEKNEGVIRYRLAKARRENFIPKNIMLEITDAGVVREAELWGNK